MTQFNFTTNIEKRMPATGKVFCIDRMTSDYAQAHPLDVDGFIESVYQEFVGTKFEESREALRKTWNDTLQMSIQGDASLYPNKNGAKRTATMKVWLRAGDYWRVGLRVGDVLPDIIPMHTVTRLDDGGWIALFPKDMHLLTDATNVQADLQSDCAEYEDLQSCIVNTDTQCDGIANPPEQEPELTVTEPVRNQSEPQQLDLFAFQQLQQENGRLRLQLSQQQTQPRTRRQRQPRKPAAVRPSHSVCPAIPLQEDSQDRQNLLKALGMVVAMTVALFVIYETGLLIPLGLIGLATGGLLK